MLKNRSTFKGAFFYIYHKLQYLSQEENKSNQAFLNFFSYYNYNSCSKFEYIREISQYK